MSITFERPEDGEVIEINYNISGGYYPATHEQPEEFPDTNCVGRIMNKTDTNYEIRFF